MEVFREVALTVANCGFTRGFGYTGTVTKCEVIFGENKDWIIKTD